MNPDCGQICLHGVKVPANSSNCQCDPGWAGIGCDSECSFHGQIVNGACVCDEGWRGPLCDIPGCPGLTKDCSGHGDCNAATHQCSCHPGWRGNGCDLSDCPGEPDCNKRGRCDTNVEPPRCLDCIAGWMGAACEEPCVNGSQVPANSGKCKCHSCYAGRGCNSECSGHGRCTGARCICDKGWRGTKCEVRGCPGKFHDCSLNGVCNSALQRCTCIPGKKLGLNYTEHSFINNGNFLFSFFFISVNCLFTFFSLFLFSFFVSFPLLFLVTLFL